MKFNVTFHGCPLPCTIAICKQDGIVATYSWQKICFIDVQATLRWGSRPWLWMFRRKECNYSDFEHDINHPGVNLTFSRNMSFWKESSLEREVCEAAASAGFFQKLLADIDQQHAHDLSGIESRFHGMDVCWRTSDSVFYVFFGNKVQSKALIR